MSRAQPDTTQSDSTTTEETYELDHVGFELEYPATRGEPPAAPANQNSRSMSDDYPGAWPVQGVPDSARGSCGTDHCGAEIRSGVMDLHTYQPETWYNESIRLGEEEGYTFAATGRGRSVFGLHTHLSPIDPDIVERITEETSSNEWCRVFFCASIDENSLDPWRHYRSSSPGHPFRGPRTRTETSDDDHYEFRLQEPVLPEHFELVCDFWRKVETEGVEAALDYARDLVLSKDERLTAIQQYRQLDERHDEWPTEQALNENNATDPAVAEWFADLMEE